MEIELTTVIAAIQQVCANGKRSFTPSSVRKMIQHLNGATVRMDAALISAKMQPHFKTLTRCGCIEFAPTVQLRNRPRRISDWNRLQILIDDPSMIESLTSAAIEAELESSDLTEDEHYVEGTELRHREEGILDVRRELLETLEERVNDLQEVMSDGNQKLLDKLHGIEQQLAALHGLLEPVHRRVDDANRPVFGETFHIPMTLGPQTSTPECAAPLVASSVNPNRPVAEMAIAENLPIWLSHWMPTSIISMTEFFASRVVFYPGSGTDGQPVQFFGKRHAAHCFVYVDYGINRDLVLRELNKHPFAGYRSVGHRELNMRDLTTNGWNPNIRPEMELDTLQATVPPYAFLEILERQPEFDDGHGPQRLAVLILCADGVAAYDSLFCQEKPTAPYAVVLQDHGYGGNWTTFGNGGALEQLASRTQRLPQFLLVATNTKAWLGYSPVPGATLSGGGSARHVRQLWQHSNHAGNTSIPPNPLRAEVSEGGSVKVDNQPPPQTPTRKPRPVADNSPRLTASECFFRSIENAAAASALVARVIAICEEHDVRVHHTHKANDGGDLRVEPDRPGPNPRKQNVITMTWRPNRGHFHCEAMLPTDECFAQGLPVDCVGPNTGHPLPSRLFVTPPVDNEAFLSIVSLSIQRFREQ